MNRLPCGQFELNKKPFDFHQANVEPPTKKARPEVPKSTAQHSKIFQCTVRAVMFRDAALAERHFYDISMYISYFSPDLRLHQQLPQQNCTNYRNWEGVAKVPPKNRAPKPGAKMPPSLPSAPAPAQAPAVPNLHVIYIYIRGCLDLFI